MSLFKRKLDQNEKLLKNIENYDKKKKAEQQKSKILEQRKTSGSKDKEESINVHNSK
tara:strand:+ start:4377 stop:4547 length:171 start_codon:yes stop_codon:yes gene_type:complete